MKTTPGVLLLLLSVACGPTPRKLGLELAAPTVEVNQGNSAYAIVSLIRNEGSAGEVTVSLDSPPEGVLAAESVSGPNSKRVTLLIHTTSVVPVGSWSLTVVGTRGAERATTGLTLKVLAAAPSSLELVDRGLENGEIDYPTALVYRAYADLEDDRLPEKYRGAPGAEAEDSSFFFDASADDLPADTKAALAPFLARPPDPISIHSVPSRVRAPDCPTIGGEHVENGWKSEIVTGVPIRVWIQCTESALEDDFLLQRVLTLAEQMYAPMTGLMGPPILDAGTGGEPSR